MKISGICRCGAGCRRAGGLWCGGAAASAAGSGYKVGDRLARPAAPAPPASDDYREISWDDLMPADWDPMALLGQARTSRDMNSMRTPTRVPWRPWLRSARPGTRPRWCPP